MRDIVPLLAVLGITMNYKGYSYLWASLGLVTSKDQVAHIRVTKDLYPFVAKRFGTSPQSVERGIATILTKCWQSNRRDLLCQLCCCTKKPTVSQFILGTLCYLHELDPIPILGSRPFPDIPEYRQ